MSIHFPSGLLIVSFGDLENRHSFVSGNLSSPLSLDVEEHVVVLLKSNLADSDYDSVQVAKSLGLKKWKLQELLSSPTWVVQFES